MPQALTFYVKTAIHFLLRSVVSVARLVTPIPDFMVLIALLAMEVKKIDVMMEWMVQEKSF